MLCAVLAMAVQPATGWAQRIVQSRGVDPRVDYAAFTRLGPWDDRNYLVTKEELALLAPNEHELKDPIPVFFRIELRKLDPGMLRTGPAQYPRSALQIFKMKYGGYLVDKHLYKEAVYRGGRFEVVQREGITQEEFETKALTTDVRVTSPTGAAESAVKIHPTNVNKVVAGSNGPGPGQIMWYSTNGGSTWTQSAALPQGNTCCDPTVDWSSNGQYAYTSALGGCSGICNVWVYRSADGGATWNDLATLTPGDGRREVTSANTSDKQFLHVDKFATSTFRDNVYLCWHDNNTLMFSRSTDFANTWSVPLAMSNGNQLGIGCDLTTDKNGNLYYFWPSGNSRNILVRKSTNGGASFNAAVTVATTQDGYDFAIPAMETRRPFIYASADADLSNGAFANSIYVSWVDTTAPESVTPANNHARIQVAYSRDGGATWTVRTPHEMGDVNTVDRFNPWLGVGPDGKVYVMFYDTRRSPTRVEVDVFYSVSSDGGNTWATPIRLTSVLSPQIDTAFEWGDYNGLDVVGSQLISTFTDNRNEGGGSADSDDVYAAGVQVGGSPPIYEGYLDGADCRNIFGWGWDQNQPNTAINIDIFRDGIYRTTVPANIFRQDLLNAGKGNGSHGFNHVPDSSWKDGLWHSVSTRFGGTSTNLTWSPRNLICKVNFKIPEPPAEFSDTLGTSWSVGNDFSSSIPGYVTHLRYYRAAEETGWHTLKLWTLSGTLLGSVTFDFGSDLTAGWETGQLPGNGIAIQAGVSYTVTVTTYTKQSKTSCGFGSGPVTNGPLSATGGRWVQGDGIFPTNGSCSNFWTDVYFDQ
jgi:hypothetical protein